MRLPIIVLAGLLLGAQAQQCVAELEGMEQLQRPKVLGYSVIAEYTHDMHAFTQGLQYDRECDEESKQCYDILWESAGLYGSSNVRKVMLSTGEVIQKEGMDKKWFAEGLTRLGDYLYQVVWQSGTMFKWPIKAGKIGQATQLQGPLTDGWGLTTDGKSLIATDSSAVVSFIDPQTLKVTRQIKVRDGGRDVKWLNELEVIGGELWANVWQTECIARINMTTGEVTHWLLLHGLRHKLHQKHPGHHEMDVLNGIAFDAEGKRLFITGKKWPRIFEIEIKHAGPHTNISIDKVRGDCIR